MTEFTLSELAEAEVVEGQGGPNAYLVRFGEGDYRMVNKTEKHRLLLETDLLQSAEGGDTRHLGYDDGTSSHVTFSADLDSDKYHITVDGNRVAVPSDHETEALEAYGDDDFHALEDIHRTIVKNRVRVGLMDRFMPRFTEARDEGRLRKSEDGWVIDETFIVKWNGENYLTKQVNQHIVQGNKTVVADEKREARQLRFDIPESFDAVDPSGSSVELTQREGRFLASVECLLNPNEYLTDEEAEYVENAVESVQDPIASLARTAQVTGFTDEKSGLYHGHGLRKHTLDMLGVTDEATERLFYNDFDHAGVHEMYARRAEFENAPFEVFEDAANDDASKWEKIKSTSAMAPIPQSTRSDIDRRFS